MKKNSVLREKLIYSIDAVAILLLASKTLSPSKK
jgi:hypothetical protein